MVALDRFTEFRYATDHDTNPLPLNMMIAGRLCELIVVGFTELSLGTGVAPIQPEPDVPQEIRSKLIPSANRAAESTRNLACDLVVLSEIILLPTF
jgi:hypothetical protein